jgi:hypothetical protein
MNDFLRKLRTLTGEVHYRIPGLSLSCILKQILAISRAGRLRAMFARIGLLGATDHWFAQRTT